jgi:hypothetical protein
MEPITRYIEKIDTDEYIQWLIGYLQRKKINFTGNHGEWSKLSLQYLLSEVVEHDVHFISKIQNAWRQHNHKIKEIENGVVSRKLSLSNQANKQLLALSQESKDPIDVTIEKLILETYHNEITNKRIDKLRHKEIKLSLEKAKAKTGRLQSLKKNLELKDGQENIAIELEKASIHIEEQVRANEELKFKLKELHKELDEKGSELEKIRIELSAEKSMTFKLDEEIRQLNNLQ